MTPRPRLLVGCVAKEVIEALKYLPDTVGVTASANQCRQDSGYSGYDVCSLRATIPGKYLQRDHWRGDSEDLIVIGGAGWDGIMVDCDEGTGSDSQLLVEAGRGEAEGSITDRVRRVVTGGGQLHSISAWCGTALRDGRNGLNRGYAASILRAWQALPFRVHNCDLLARDDMRFLADEGADSFNIAPALGYELMRYYEGTDVGDTDWMVQVKNGGEWKRWTHDSSEAMLWGGHYYLETLPYRYKHFEGAVQYIAAYIQEILSWVT